MVYSKISYACKNLFEFSSEYPKSILISKESSYFSNFSNL